MLLIDYICLGSMNFSKIKFNQISHNIIHKMPVYYLLYSDPLVTYCIAERHPLANLFNYLQMVNVGDKLVKIIRTRMLLLFSYVDIYYINLQLQNIFVKLI